MAEPGAQITYKVEGHDTAAKLTMFVGSWALAPTPLVSVDLDDPSIPFRLSAEADENVDKGLRHLAFHRRPDSIPVERGPDIVMEPNPLPTMWIRQAELRSRAYVSLMQTWCRVALEYQAWRRSGGPELTLPPQVDLQAAVLAARAALAEPRERAPGGRLRGDAKAELMRAVAQDYRDAIALGDHHPKVTIAARRGYSQAHIGRLLVEARKAGLLGPAPTGRAGEVHPTTRKRKP